MGEVNENPVKFPRTTLIGQSIERFPDLPVTTEFTFGKNAREAGDNPSRVGVNDCQPVASGETLDGSRHIVPYLWQGTQGLEISWYRPFRSRHHICAQAKDVPSPPVKTQKPKKSPNLALGSRPQERAVWEHLKESVIDRDDPFGPCSLARPQW